MSQYVETINGRLSTGDRIVVALNCMRFQAIYLREIAGRSHRCVVGILNGKKNKDGKARMVRKSVATRKVQRA